MTLLKRLRNLVELSKLEPSNDGRAVKLRPSGKPKGMAKIVPMEDPIVDHFKDETDPS